MITANDPHWDTLTEAAQAARTNPQAWLDQNQYYNHLSDNAAFAASFTAWLNLIWADGTEAALTTYAAGNAPG